MNRKEIRCCFYAACLLFAAGCTPQAPEAGQADIAAIKAVLERQVQAWNRGDIDAFMQGYWNSDELVFVSNRVLRGWQAALERYKSAYDTREKMGTLHFAVLRVDKLGSGYAKVLGQWDIARQPENIGGYFTLIFRKMEGGWKIIHDHTSSRKVQLSEEH